MKKVISIIMIITIIIMGIDSECKKAEAAVPLVLTTGAAAVIAASLVAAGLIFDNEEEGNAAVGNAWNHLSEETKQWAINNGNLSVGTPIEILQSHWTDILGYVVSYYAAGDNAVIGSIQRDCINGAEFTLTQNPHFDEIAYVEASTGAIAGWGPYFNDIAGTSLDVRFARNQLDIRLGNQTAWDYMLIPNTSCNLHYLWAVLYNPATNCLTVDVCMNQGIKCNTHSTEQVQLFHHPLDAPQQSATGVCTHSPAASSKKILTDAEELAMFNQGTTFEQEVEENITALPTVDDVNYTWMNENTGDMTIAHPGTVANTVGLTQSQVQNGEIAMTIPIDVPIVDVQEFDWPAFPSDVSIENIMTWVGDIIKYAFLWLGGVLEMILGLLKGLYYAALQMLQKIGAMSDYINPNSPNFFITRWFTIPDGYWAAFYAAIAEALGEKLPFMVWPDLEVTEQAFPNFTIQLYGQELLLVNGTWVNQYGPYCKTILSMGIWLITFVSIWPKIAEMLGQGGGSK